MIFWKSNTNDMVHPFIGLKLNKILILKLKENPTKTEYCVSRGLKMSHYRNFEREFLENSQWKCFFDQIDWILFPFRYFSKNGFCKLSLNTWGYGMGFCYFHLFIYNARLRNQLVRSIEKHFLIYLMDSPPFEMIK